MRLLFVAAACAVALGIWSGVGVEASGHDDDTLYLIKSNAGILSAFDARTGTPHYQLQRLAGVSNVFASPVGAGGRVYIAGCDGTTLVIRQGSTFEVLATNVLDDRFDASPAVVGNQIYLRGHRHLYAIGGAE